MYTLVKTVFNDFTLPKKFKKNKLSLEEYVNKIMLIYARIIYDSCIDFGHIFVGT